MQDSDERIRGIADRIRAERQRLGYNQADFAALGGASRRALTEWEKGGSMPNASVLSAWHQGNVDVLFIVTGNREGQSGTGLSAREAEAVIGKWEDEATTDEGRNELTRIATDEALPDRTRARADLALRAIYKDEDAEARQAQRFHRSRRDQEAAETIVSDAITATGYEPPTPIRARLVDLVRYYKVDGETVTTFLYDLKQLPQGSS